MNLKFWERKPQPKPNSSMLVTATTKLAALTAENTRIIIEKVPIRWISEGRLTEADLGLASTTPILGQYAPAFGWPDDWGLYWEYLDGYLFIPEVGFATNLKTRLVWKPGFELETKDEHARKEFMDNWRKLRLYQRLRGATWNALVWGNAYLEIVDNSKAEWEYAQPPQLNNAMGVGGARPLKSWRPATKFYGLKQMDPRTMRVQINPLAFDLKTAEPLVEKFIQRRWTGPLGPTQSSVMAGPETDFHPDQILHIPFNKIGDGIYGYCAFRPVFYALKGYMVMLQFLPAIVQKRADPRLLFKLGGEIIGPDEKKSTYLPNAEDYATWKGNLVNVAPGEDFYTDQMTSIEEIFSRSVGSTLQGIREYIDVWKERIYMGLGIPPSLVDLARQGAETKFGSLKQEILEDEISDCQTQMEFIINEKLTPRLTTGDCEFHFNPITPEDWQAMTTPLINLYKEGIISAEYVVQRLNFPDVARQGTFYQAPTAPLPEKPQLSPEEKIKAQLDFHGKKAQMTAAAFVKEIRKQGE